MVIPTFQETYITLVNNFFTFLVVFYLSKTLVEFFRKKALSIKQTILTLTVVAYMIVLGALIVDMFKTVINYYDFNGGINYITLVFPDVVAISFYTIIYILLGSLLFTLLLTLFDKFAEKRKLTPQYKTIIFFATVILIYLLIPKPTSITTHSDIDPTIRKTCLCYGIGFEKNTWCSGFLASCTEKNLGYPEYPDTTPVR